MSGNVFVNLVNPLTAPGFALPGTHLSTILSAQGGETHSGLTLTAYDTAVINYSLTYPGTQDIDLQYVINYSPVGLTQNEQAVGNAVNLIQGAQISPAFRPIAVNLSSICLTSRRSPQLMIRYRAKAFLRRSRARSTPTTTSYQRPTLRSNAGSPARAATIPQARPCTRNRLCCRLEKTNPPSRRPVRLARCRAPGGSGGPALAEDQTGKATRLPGRPR